MNDNDNTVTTAPSLSPYPRQQQQQQKHQRYTLDQLQDARNALQFPLTDRSVLVPLGSRAYLPGRLAPAQVVSDTTPALSSTIGSGECVCLCLDGEVGVEMCREDALCRVQREIDQRIEQRRRSVTATTTGNPSDPSNIRNKTSNSIKSSPPSYDGGNSHQPTRGTGGERSTATLSTTTTTNSSETVDVPVPTAVPAPPPHYYEIREEIDDSGMEIRAEAINVSRQLEYWQKLTREQQLNEDGDDDSNPSHNNRINSNDDDKNPKTVSDPVTSVPSVQPTTTAMSARTDIIVNEPKDIQHDEVEEDGATTTIGGGQSGGASSTPVVVSDAEYSSIMARLDELILLEERAETQKSINKKSSKTLQSKGWSKGFFNTTATKKTKTSKKTTSAATPSSNPKTAVTMESAKPPGVNVEGTQQQQQQQLPSNDTTTAAVVPNSVVKTVGFTGQDQIQEIPRIGERSVKTLMVPRQQPRSAASTTIQPLDTTVFPGIVTEKTRQSVESIVPPSQQQQQHQQQHRSSSSKPIKLSADAHHAAKSTKLSRFAQQRQQAQRE